MNIDTKIEAIEDRIEAIEDQLAAFIDTINYLKERVAPLDKEGAIKVSDVNKEISDLIKLQPVIDELVVANSNAIEILRKEIKSIPTNNINDQHAVNKNTNCVTKNTADYTESNSNMKCSYFNRGFCKNRQNCKMVHEETICKKFLNGEYCNWLICSFRHPKTCYYYHNNGGCMFGQTCVYMHQSKPLKNIQILHSSSPKR